MSGRIGEQRSPAKQRPYIFEIHMPWCDDEPRLLSAYFRLVTLYLHQLRHKDADKVETFTNPKSILSIPREKIYQKSFNFDSPEFDRTRLLLLVRPQRSVYTERRANRMQPAVRRQVSELGKSAARLLCLAKWGFASHSGDLSWQLCRSAFRKRSRELKDC
ncbi:hypothetical protein R1flu_027442 [Riccia fluitans]|uniref:Maturase K n=1 Tax=Riccia fluitans TaxID=41844 RepID=A0ABD1XIV0_9MARC